MRNERDTPSPVRLKKLLPMPVVSKRLKVMNTKDTGMGLNWWAWNNVPLGPANASGVTNVIKRTKSRRCIVQTTTRLAGSRRGVCMRVERHPRHKEELLGNE